MKENNNSYAFVSCPFHCSRHVSWYQSSYSQFIPKNRLSGNSYELQKGVNCPSKTTPSMGGNNSPKRQRGNVQPNKPFKHDDGDEDDVETDEELSRRVFLAGTTFSALITAATSYRYFVGEDAESAIRRRLYRNFPKFFKSPDATPSQYNQKFTRVKLDSKFASTYFNTLESTALKMKFITSINELHQSENEVRSRSKKLFFYNDDDNDNIDEINYQLLNDEQLYSDEQIFNFLLYARLRIISMNTSPKSRLQFSYSVAKQTLPLLLSRMANQQQSNSSNAVQTQKYKTFQIENASEWLDAIADLLKVLVSIGWISAFKVDRFDPDLWIEDRTTTLTIYSYDVVTIQAAQLIGEEAYEELSPKVSPWISAFLTEYCGSIKVSSEDYYLDDVYRPDPAYYKPTILATQFDLSFP